MKDKQKEAQKRKQDLKKKAAESGVLDEAAKFLSAMYLLQSECTSLLADLEAILEEGGYMVGSMKYDIEALNKAFDKFFGKFSKFIGKDKINQYTNDLDNFNNQFKRYTGL
mgnify:CR=1 FL=1